MKKFRRVAIVLATLMMWCLAVTGAMAAEEKETHTVTVTINYDKNHTYEAYQIFAGGSQGDAGHLGDIAWGDGVDKTKLLADKDLQSLLGITGSEDVDQVASKIAAIQSGSVEARQLARIIYKYKTETGTKLKNGSNTLPVGYYLIVDTTDLSGKNDANNLAILQLTDNITINQKVGIPTVTKKVKEGSLDDYNDVADYTIGDTIPFKLTATLPENYSRFETYQLIFHDTMGSGLTVDTSSFVVKVGGVIANSDGYELVEDGHKKSDGTKDSFCLKIPDVNQLVSAEEDKVINAVEGVPVTVIFNGSLNEQANIGPEGNINTVTLEYSNHPNEKTKTGETLQDQVIVLTYGLKIKKVDRSNPDKVLSGAKFLLMDSNGANARYAKVNDSGTFVEWTKDKASATVLTTDKDGMTKVYGLDEGTYYLKETAAPNGYQTPASPFGVTIKANTDSVVSDYESGPYSALAVTVSVNQGTEEKGSGGVVTATVENGQGSLLPTTGGRGLYILYAVGIFFLAAGVTYQVRKKRRAS
jgi:fimbrial isopeptide formation D2 family protein